MGLLTAAKMGTSGITPRRVPLDRVIRHGSRGAHRDGPNGQQSTKDTNEKLLHKSPPGMMNRWWSPSSPSMSRYVALIPRSATSRSVTLPGVPGPPPESARVGVAEVAGSGLEIACGGAPGGCTARAKPRGSGGGARGGRPNSQRWVIEWATCIKNRAADTRPLLAAVHPVGAPRGPSPVDRGAGRGVVAPIRNGGSSSGPRASRTGPRTRGPYQGLPQYLSPLCAAHPLGAPPQAKRHPKTQAHPGGVGSIRWPMVPTSHRGEPPATRSGPHCKCQGLPDIIVEE